MLFVGGNFDEVARRISEDEHFVPRLKDDSQRLETLALRVEIGDFEVEAHATFGWLYLGLLSYRVKDKIGLTAPDESAVAIFEECGPTGKPLIELCLLLVIPRREHDVI